MKHFHFLFLLLLSFQLYAQNSLEFYVNKALENSPLLQKQNNENNILDLDIKQFEKIYNSPTVNLNANVLFATIISTDNGNTKFELVSAGANKYYGYDLGASNGGQYQALIAVNQPLFTKQHLNAQKTKANVLKEKYTNQVTLTKLELKQTVTHQYILCLQAEKNIENTKEIIQILKSQLKEMNPYLIKKLNFCLGIIYNEIASTTFFGYKLILKSI